MKKAKIKILSKQELRKIILDKKISLDTLDISNITNMSSLFKDIYEIKGSISSWDVSNVTSMQRMFQGSRINPDISSWNISSVKNMKSMFESSSFNQNLGSWNLVDKNIDNIFKNCSYNLQKYNIDRGKIHEYEIIKIKDRNRNKLRKIIEDGIIPLDKIDVSGLSDMTQLFYGIKNINGSISDWNTSNVTDMKLLFAFSKINQDISKWDVSSVKNMGGMFHSSKFNKDISKWNVSSVEIMRGMFEGSKFNKDISSWNVSNVRDMIGIFNDSSFNQNLGTWDLSEHYIDDIFFDCKYTPKKYQIDRKEYLNTVQLEKDKIAKQENEKYLAKTKIAINQDLNKDIILSSIELEF